MKKQQTARYKFATGFAMLVIILWGCKDNLSDAGLNLLPKNDLVKVAQVVEKSTIQAHTELDGNQRTDKPAFNLLGTYNDSIFGKTNAGFACQFRLSRFPDSIFTKGAQVDSVVLYFYYKEIVGDTITPQHLKVYELTSDLDPNTKYYQDVDLKGMTNGIPLADMTYTPKFKLDSLNTAYGSTKANPKDTLQQVLAIKLNNSFAQKLFSADSTIFASNDDFLQYFKGLYIEAEDMNQGGALMSIPTTGTYSSTTGTYSINPSYLVLHFHNDGSDSLYFDIGVKSSAARINHFSHDYSNTTFSSQLNDPESPDSLLYLQTTGGLKAKVIIPSLGNWSDSTDVIVNGAELVFQVDTTVSSLSSNYPPERLILTAIAKNTSGLDSTYLPSDYYFSSTYYNGVYNSIDKTYRFNIVNHLQDIIDKKEGKENLGFYLTTSYLGSNYASSVYRRVALKSPSSKTGIRLNITYSKMK